MAGEPENLVLELLRGIRAEVADIKSEMATKGELAELRTELKADMNSLRADVASDLLALRADVKAEFKNVGDQIAGIRRAVFEYHSVVVGHCVLISELDARCGARSGTWTFRRSTPIDAVPGTIPGSSPGTAVGRSPRGYFASALSVTAKL